MHRYNMCTHRCKLSEEIDMMREDTARILNEWASVLEFNPVFFPDQRSFDLGIFSLVIHLAGERL